jgi:RNA polymerase sigma-70 factor (ECF subfamily)
LTPRAQLALRMRYTDRKPRLEIAQALSLSEHGAKNLMQRAKGVLRKCVERKLRS